MSTSNPKKIALIGTLDTKGEELGFVKSIVSDRNHHAVVIDTGIKGTPAIEADVSREEVAAADGASIDSLLAASDKNQAIQTMARGARKIVQQMYLSGELDGVFGVGGVQGTVISTTAMQGLPIGIPKFVLSTVANGQAMFGPFIGTRDIAIMHSVGDILGLNSLTRQMLARAAGAIIGMVETEPPQQADSQTTIALSMLGVTTPSAMHIRQLLEHQGFEVIAFHGNGVGTSAMEEMVAEGRIRGVIDLSPHDISGLLHDGLMRASPNRLEPQCAAGLPIVFVPGGLDFILHGGVETISPKVLQRKYVIHNPVHTHVRANYEEMLEAGRFVGSRLRNAKGAATVILPTRGFSQLNTEGQVLYDPAADRGFLDGLREVLGNDNNGTPAILELDFHINDALFAEKVAEAMAESLADA